MEVDNKSIYDANWERWSDQKIFGPASRWLRWLVAQNLEHVDAATVADVIDVGCGQGATTMMLAERLPDARVVGIDFSDSGIAVANRNYARANLSFHADQTSDRLDLERYDLATCFEVLEHVDDWTGFLQRICGASRRYVMLSFPTGRMRAFEPSVGHLRNFARGQVEAAMSSNGYRTKNVFYAGFPFYSPIYRDMCNLLNVGTGDFASGRYGFAQKSVAALLFVSFRYLSSRHRGDQFCGLFERK